MFCLGTALYWASIAGGLSVAQAAAIDKASPPTANDVGPSQILLDNDLSPGSRPGAAIALLSSASNQDAQKKCALLNEELLGLPQSGTDNRTAIDNELNYLQFANITTSPQIWVANQQRKRGDCSVYDIPSKQVKSAPCSTPLNALCTSSGHPTTDVTDHAHPRFYMQVKSGDWELTGYRDARTYKFLGVPFADPPVGNLRFASPRPFSGDKTRFATKFGHDCPQGFDNAGTVNGTNESEDCLNINIFTPYLPGSDSKSDNKLKPVGVYFYGGDFMYGTINQNSYQGHNFASRNDIVIVTVNYRLGLLGQLTTKSILEGNYATQDQIQALKWVQENIKAFGGDPKRVTIFGQSAGGQSVTALLSSSQAKGLFSAAIPQSAPVDLPWFSHELYYDTIAPNTAHVLGCPSDDEKEMVGCLRQLPFEKLIANETMQMISVYLDSLDIGPKYFKASPFLGLIEYFIPHVGGPGNNVIDGQFYDMLKTGNLPNKVPTMFTQVEDEAFLFIDAQIQDNLGNSNLTSFAANALAISPEEAVGMLHDPAFALNESDPDAVRNEIAKIYTAREWLCPQEYLLSNFGHEFPAVYQLMIKDGHVQSDYDPPGSLTPSMCYDNRDYSCHMAEVILVWGTLDSATKYVQPYRSEEEVRYSQLLNDVWSAFMRSHTPNLDADFLRARGASYNYSLSVVEGDTGYRFRPYGSPEDTNVLGYKDVMGHRPSRYQDMCPFFDKNGYTFQKV